MAWDIRGKTVLITGGNTGIGKATATELARRGAEVVITSRDPAKGEAAVAEIRSEAGGAAVSWRPLDLASLRSVGELVRDLVVALPRLDVLVHNAGLVLSERRESADGYEMTFATNHLGPFALQRGLDPLLRRSAPARVVVVASSAHARVRRGLDFDDLPSARPYSGVHAYAASKLANILFTRELARRLARSGVTANALHPGVVASNFTRDGDAGGLWGFVFRWFRPLLLTPQEGARTSVFLACAPELEGRSGEYFVRCRAVEPSRAARDAAAARRLWEMSESLCSGAEPSAD